MMIISTPAGAASAALPFPPSPLIRYVSHSECCVNIFPPQRAPKMPVSAHHVTIELVGKKQVLLAPESSLTVKCSTATAGSAPQKYCRVLPRRIHGLSDSIQNEVQRDG